MAVCQGALVNSRLDRLLGIDYIRNFLRNAELGKIEELRQACLYTPIGRTEFPAASAISKDEANRLCVLSGEIMADVLGNFPWEFERMMSEVSDFEKLIGY